jgi:hypothetical protein
VVQSPGTKAERIPQLISDCQSANPDPLDGVFLDLDIRVPIAFLFLLLGTLLCGYGVLGTPQTGIVQPGFNVNVAWGAVMALFGAILLAAAWASRQQK